MELVSRPSTVSYEDTSASGVLESWSALLRRRWPSGLVVFLAVMLLSVAVVFLSRPIYRAESRLRLGEPPPSTGVSPNAGIFGLFRVGGDPFANDLELLGSRTVAAGVVSDRVLHVILVAPRGWHRDSIFQLLESGQGTSRASFETTWTEDGSVQVRMTAPADSLIGSVAPGARISFGGVTASFLPWRPQMPREVTIRTVPFAEAVRLTGEAVQYERTARDANVVEIRFEHTDPDLARGVVESVVARFTELRAAIQRRESGETSDSLRVVAAETRVELAQAEADLEEFERRSRLVSAEAQSAAFIERYGEAVTELERGRAELAAVESVLARTADVAKSSEAWTRLASHPRFLDNPTVGVMLERLTELEGQRTEAAARRTDVSADVRVLDEQIGYLDGALRSLARNYREGLEEQVADLARRVASMEATLAATPAQIIELGRRQRAVRLLSEVLVLTEQRLRQEELREALTFSNVQVIDPPALRDRPVWPPKKLGLAVGFLLASVFGALAVVVQERADRSVRRAAEIRAAIGVPVIAAVTRGPDGTVTLGPDDAGTLIRHAAGDGRAGRLVLIAVTEEGPARELARALWARGAPRLREGGDSGVADEAPAATGVAVTAVERDAGAARTLEVSVLPRPHSFAEAAQAAAGGASVTLVVEHARTRRDELRRLLELLTDAGAAVAGVIVVCDDPDDVARVWE